MDTNYKNRHLKFDIEVKNFDFSGLNKEGIAKTVPDVSSISLEKFNQIASVEKCPSSVCLVNRKIQTLADIVENLENLPSDYNGGKQALDKIRILLLSMIGITVCAIIGLSLPAFPLILLLPIGLFSLAYLATALMTAYQLDNAKEPLIHRVFGYILSCVPFLNLLIVKMTDKKWYLNTIAVLSHFDIKWDLTKVSNWFTTLELQEWENRLNEIENSEAALKEFQAAYAFYAQTK